MQKFVGNKGRVQNRTYVGSTLQKVLKLDPRKPRHKANESERNVKAGILEDNEISFGHSIQCKEKNSSNLIIGSTST
jgi:hypothetical protein